MEKLSLILINRQWRFLFLSVCLCLCSAIGYAQNNVKVSGTVADNTGEPLLGVSVVVKGAVSMGTVTDMEGKYSLTVPSTGSVLQFSYLGYTTQEITVGSRTEINVTLLEDTKTLDELVVVGYGTMRKKDLTGSITQIRPDKLASENPKTIQDVLRGTAGLAIAYDPTAKGGGSIQLRGQRSTYTAGGHNDPLIILDGMMFMGELSEINLNDIEQVDILKDASAAAIYGAQAANGVLIITTKKGKIGKPIVSVNANFGITQKSSYREVWNPEEYIQHRIDWYKRESYGINPATGKYEAYQAGSNPRAYFENPANLGQWGVDLDTWRNSGSITPSAGESDLSLFARRIGFGGEGGAEVLLPNFLAGKTFDWYDHTFRTGTNQDYNASVSGSSERMNYYMSLGYASNEGAIQGNHFDNVRSNLKVEGKVNNWLEIGANVNFQHRSDGDYQPVLHTENSAAQSNQIRNSPYSNYQNEDGSLTQYPAGTGVRLSHTNFDWLKQYRDNIDRGYVVLNAIFNAKVKLPFGFSYTFNASPRYQWYHSYTWNSSAEPDTSHGGEVDRDNSWWFNWSINNQIHLDKTFNDVHKLNLTLVQEAERRQSWNDEIDADKFEPSDALGYHNTANATTKFLKTEDTQHSAEAFLARLFYSYNDRYMITGSLRRDGYSAFGTSNPYATFPSLGAAWTFTNESFFNWEPMTYGKLRVSWGKNGNRGLDNPYQSLADLQTGGDQRYVYINSAGTPVFFHYLQINRMANPNLQWEKSEQINLGLDFGFLKNRLTGTIEYYSTTTRDMIMNQTLVGFGGFPTMTSNLGEVSNKGVEFSLTSVNIKNPNFEWSTTFNFSYNKNKILHLYYEYKDVLDKDGNVIGRKEKDDANNNWFIGQPIGTIWAHRVIGIWQENEIEEAAKYGQRPGDPKIYKNPDNPLQVSATTGKIAYNNDDKEFLGQTTPPVNWSLRNDFMLFRDWSLSINMYARMGHKSISNQFLNDDNNSNAVTQHANHYKKEYWTPENPSNRYARIQASNGGNGGDPYLVFDRSFIRLENISLGYNVPKKITSKADIENLKIFGSVRNVAVWCKDWPYGDPETYNASGDTNNPYSGGLATRVFSLGLNVTF